MTRRLPNCAHCGTPLKKAKGRCVLKFQALPGRPSVGWCERCDWGLADPEFRRLRVDQTKPSAPGVAEAVLAAVAARGPDRVRRGPT